MPKEKDELESAQPKTEAVSESTTEPTAEVKEEAVAEDAKAEKPKTEAKPAAKTKPVKAPDKPVSEIKTDSDAGAAAVKPGRPMDVRGLVIKVGVAVVALLALTLITFGVLIYAYQSENSAVKAVAGIVPYPVEKVNGTYVPYRDYLFEIDANQRAYQNNAKLNNQPAVDFTTADGKKMLKEIKQHALDKLKSDAVIAQLASQKKVTVTDKETNDLINDLYKRYGGKDTLLKTLNQIYGWNLNDLRKVVRKQLLTQKLEDKVVNDPAVDAQAKAKAQDVLGKVKAGGDFGELAKQYSQASDASSGGDLGSVTKGQLPDDQQKAIDALQPGQVSDLVKTQYGYEIIKVNEKDGDTAKAQHILIKTVDFNDYMNDQISKAKSKPYITIK